jgi:type I restriction enzyme S subunit
MRNPPLEEQRRIIAKIEELMGRVREARRLQEEAKKDADRLWQATLAEVFPRPGTESPLGWRWVKLGEVAKIRYGKANPRAPGQVPVIGSGGIYDYTAIPLITYPTVIIGRKGTAGEAKLVTKPCWPSDTTFYLEWKYAIDPAWVAYWLTTHKPSPVGKTATLPSISRNDLEEFLIPLPPLSEQRRIVAYLEQVQAKIKALKEAQEQTETELQRLEQAILAGAFKGEL